MIPLLEMMRLSVVLALVLLTLLSPSLARGAGRLPTATAIVFDPHESRTVLVRTTFGPVVTRDNGDSWRWICDRAIGAAGSEEPTYAFTPKGTLLAATAAGLAVSRDGGCTFAFVGGAGVHAFGALALRADGEIVGVTSRPDASGARFDNHLVVSKDDGESLAPSGGPIDPTVHVESIALAPSEPGRLYIAGSRGEGDERSAAFFASYNGGLSWVERKLESALGESARVAGVDPTNADRVYVRTLDAARGRLLVTDDAGKTWKKPFEGASTLTAFALADDGKRLFGGSREGVWSSAVDTFARAKGSGIDAQCLATRGSQLWACSTEKSGFFVGISRSGGRSFDATLRLDEIKGPLECAPESSVGQACGAEWPGVRRELGLPEEGDKPRSADPGAPALRGRAQRTGRSRGGMAAFAGIALVGLVGYNILKRLRRR